MLLGTHILGQNPEFPDMIFSGSDHEQSEKKHSTVNSDSVVANNIQTVNNQDTMDPTGSCAPTKLPSDSGNSQFTPPINNAAESFAQITQKSSGMETEDTCNTNTQDKKEMISDTKQNNDKPTNGDGNQNGGGQMNSSESGDKEEPIDQSMENGVP